MIYLAAIKFTENRNPARTPLWIEAATMQNAIAIILRHAECAAGRALYRRLKWAGRARAVPPSIDEVDFLSL
jgi:hypothetical protein